MTRLIIVGIILCVVSPVVVGDCEVSDEREEKNDEL